MAFGKCFLLDMGVVLKGQDSTIVAAQVANYSTRISLSCPLL